jgi:thiol:disulfide interchange protein DsbC
MSHRRKILGGLVVLATACALTTARADEPSANVRAAIVAKVPGAKPENIRVSPVPGLYEVALGAYVVYVSGDGRYLFDGDLYDVESRQNVTETRRTAARATALATADESEMIVFKPAKVKHTISVFTDIDCGYCRKLHGEIAELNELGIEVRYLAYPRSGPGTDSWAKAEAVWCSSDRRSAITRAKKGEEVVRPADCKNAHVDEQYALGEEMGVRGTPAIITENGDYLGGYLPPAKLAQYLDQLDAERVAAKP